MIGIWRGSGGVDGGRRRVERSSGTSTRSSERRSTGERSDADATTVRERYKLRCTVESRYFQIEPLPRSKLLVDPSSSSSNLHRDSIAVASNERRYWTLERRREVLSGNYDSESSFPRPPLEVGLVRSRRRAPDPDFVDLGGVWRGYPIGTTKEEEQVGVEGDDDDEHDCSWCERLERSEEEEEQENEVRPLVEATRLRSKGERT